MKGYKEQLNNFINYIFRTYNKDNTVNEFKAIFAIQEAKRTARKQSIKKDKKMLVISEKTADLCGGLINIEITKGKMLGGYTKEYMNDLENAKLELVGRQMTSLLRRINNVK